MGMGDCNKLHIVRDRALPSEGSLPSTLYAVR